MDISFTGEDETLEWTCLQDGVYYAKLSNYLSSGVDTGYDLKLSDPTAPLVLGTLMGTVTAATSGAAISGAVIRTSYNWVSMSDPNGEYYLPHYAGTYDITVISSGYENYNDSFTISGSETVNKNISMSPTCEDGDGDGYGNPGYSSCPNGGAYDCNDGNAAINPGATEVCDAADNNCDGYINEGFLDTDVDGVADYEDSDDDNDGIADGSDSCPLTKPARAVGSTTDYFSTLQGAYDWADDGDEIQCQDEIIDGNVTIDDPVSKAVTFKGGYDCSYSTVTGVTTINGNMTISEGILTIDSGTLELQ